MFKRKNNQSQNNDEVYVDYSKDIDVKKTEKDEALPEHYEALEIEDEVVVSASQIKEATQLKKQSEFIEQKRREIAIEKEKNVTDDYENTDAIKEEIETIDEDVSHLSNEQEVMSNQETDEDVSDSDENNLRDKEEIVDEPINIDDAFEQESDREKEHRIYPSFLHEELSVRRTMNPLDKIEGSNVEQENKEQPKKDIEVSQEIEDIQEETSEEEQMEEETIDISIDDEQDNIEKKHDLHRFFGVDASVLKRGAKKRKKIEKKSLDENARKPLYTYQHHQFYSMEEFTSFLNSNYVNLDVIAQKILNDERFFRWLKEESDQFEESIIRMKKLKQDLKQ
ncbi:MAG: hypothetical protein ACVCEJ_10525 [Candidatus Izemoplasmataceae bacterium]